MDSGGEMVVIESPLSLQCLPGFRWLLTVWSQSQSTLETGSASEPGQTVSTQGYTDLIKASWVLIDVIARHPQFNLLDSMIRLDAEQLAEVGDLLFFAWIERRLAN